MRIGSLFAGVGGLELGLSWALVAAGFEVETVWQVEIDPFCRAVLEMHWPNAKRFSDVTTVGRADLAPVDIICGGFPCQDVSTMGHGAGLDGARSGLWREYARIVEELRPRAVVVENVAALVSRGLDRVVEDLDRLGYCVHGRIIAAADVGAPHLRRRLFLVAHASGERHQEARAELDEHGASESRSAGALADSRDDRREGGREAHDIDGRDALRHDADGHDPHVPDADRDAHGDAVRQPKQRQSRRRTGGVRDEGRALTDDARASGAPEYAVLRSSDGESSPEPGVRRGADGLPARVDRWPGRPGDAPALWEPARAVTLVGNTHAARLHALGNAVVPQVAEEAGRLLVELLRTEAA